MVCYDLAKSVAVIPLAAVYSVVSQLALAPVYGSTPARVYHQALCSTAVLTGYLLGSRFSQIFHKGQKFLPALAFAIPNIQFFLFQYSSQWGNPAGPLLTELCTIAPLVLLSAAASSTLLKSLNLRQYGAVIAEIVPPIGGLLFFNLVHATIQSAIPLQLDSTLSITSFRLQIGTAALYTIALPRSQFRTLYALTAVFFSLAFSVYMPFACTAAKLNSRLQEINYSLVDRQESLTGYISVLDNMQVGFRAMRCDHSLLGGQWTNWHSGYNPRVSDPIYAVFTMLESVRLVEPDNNSPAKKDAESNALVIGLGIGTTPAALIQHGIDTTIVEIDPIVYKFALQYFQFPRNHTAVIDNAVTFVETAQRQTQQYDYIVHDVFTGGVEPIELFTLEFLQGLYALLKDDGIVAINYAGDLSLPGAGLIVRTIRSVFPQCRIFRENDGLEKSDTDPLGFTNMVIFCKKSSQAPLTFRAPNEGDYLGSKSRESYMYPQHEIDPKLFDGANDMTDQQILQVGKTSLIEAYHLQNAIGHWNIMRGVLPAKVWENF
ncbi:hypothetical protein PISL3812_04665 [Talaromyces islandicus]|uniref:Spermine/spermidine synthase family protein n=1 Tax=Talaromyces islandicus TaxID=28573 RepID=A0A0U1LWP6_TALIS|nr:hypothetical protein PISL3812_04665 [Talaromyces islandicus]